MNTKIFLLLLREAHPGYEYRVIGHGKSQQIENRAGSEGSWMFTCYLDEVYENEGGILMADGWPL